MTTQKEEIRTSLHENDNKSAEAGPISNEAAASLQIDAPMAELPTSQRSIDLSIEGSERLIYEQEYAQTPNVLTAKHFINYHICWLLITAAEFGVLGLSMVTAYNSRIPDFAYLFFFYSVSSLLKLTVMLYFSIVDEANSKNYARTMFDAVGSAICYHGFYFYLIGVYRSEFLVACTITNLVIFVTKLVVFGKNINNFALEMLLLFETLIYIALAVKIGYPLEEISWAALQILCTSIFYSLIYFVSALSFFVLLFTVVTLFRIGNVNETDCAGLLYLYVIWFVSAVFGSIVCLLFIGVRPLIELNAVKPYPLPFEGMPEQVSFCGFMSYFLGTLMAGFALFVQFKLKNTILRRISNSSARKIWFKRYFQSLTVNLINVSGNFFKRFDPRSKPKDIENKDFDDCVVCQASPSSYLLFPCKHAVLCEFCIRSFLETQDRCPVCKTAISRSVHLVYDGKQKFTADHVFKLAAN